MRRKLGLALVLGLALTSVPAYTGCGGGSGPSDSGCASAGQSCMSRNCCPHADGSFSMSRTFSYPGGVQTMTSCTCR